MTNKVEPHSEDERLIKRALMRVITQVAKDIQFTEKGEKLAESERLIKEHRVQLDNMIYDATKQAKNIFGL